MHYNKHAGLLKTSAVVIEYDGHHTIGLLFRLKTILMLLQPCHRQMNPYLCPIINYDLTRMGLITDCYAYYN